MKIEISTAKQYRLHKDYYRKMGLIKIGNKVLLKEDFPHNLPDNLTVEGNLYLPYSNFTSLPEGLEVGGHLHLSKNNLKSLPEDLKVGGNLYLWENNFPKDYKIPDTVEIGGRIVGL